MSRQNRKKQMAEINVVPYIDVMLVLLVIFMVTAPILAQGIKVDLPKAVAKPLETEQNQESLIVSITADGTYVLERGENAETASELSFIQEYTGKVLRQQPATPVYIRGDRSIEYGVVVELMAALQIAGAESVGLITEVP